MDDSTATTLILLGVGIFLILSAFVYYRTSDTYKLRETKKKLGYEVESYGEMFKKFLKKLAGSSNNQDWKKNNKPFTTPDYGPADNEWMVVKPTSQKFQEWQLLPRGDDKIRKKMISSAVAKAKTIVVEQILEDAIMKEWNRFEQEAARSEPERRRMEKIRAKSVVLSNEPEMMQKLDELIKAQEAAEKKEEAELIVIGESDSDKDDEEDDAVHVELKAARISLAPFMFNAMGANRTEDARFDDDIKPVAAIPLDKKASLPVIRMDMSRVISPLELRRSIAHLSEDDFVKTEFSRIPLNIPAMVENEELIREGAYAPHAHTRVKLQVLKSNAKASDFINANYVRGANGLPNKFIVTQGPLAGVEKKKQPTINSFWSMVWDHGCPAIVMLCDIGYDTSAMYWPKKIGSSVTYGDLIVTNKDMHVKPEYTKTSLSIKSKNDPNRFLNLSHFQFVDWDRNSCPSTAGGLLAFLHDIHTETSRYTESIVIHDGNGYDRVGVVLSIEHLIWQVETQGSLDILGTVATLREDRPAMVGTLEQYLFIHKALAIYCTTTEKTPLPPQYVPTPQFDDDDDDAPPPGPPPADTESELEEDAALALALDNKSLTPQNIADRKETVKEEKMSRSPRVYSKFPQGPARPVAEDEMDLDLDRAPSPDLDRAPSPPAEDGGDELDRAPSPDDLNRAPSPTLI